MAIFSSTSAAAPQPAAEGHRWPSRILDTLLFGKLTQYPIGAAGGIAGGYYAATNFGSVVANLTVTESSTLAYTYLLSSPVGYGIAAGVGGLVGAQLTLGALDFVKEGFLTGIDRIVDLTEDAVLGTLKLGWRATRKAGSIGYNYLIKAPYDAYTQPKQPQIEVVKDLADEDEFFECNEALPA